ncbi:MAG: hypothetical protein DRP65_12265 [Planctomycetota bacterium]|nr:MAG: hypothetical protein DRP65_12265 [Planctomycetota bacterium]
MKKTTIISIIMFALILLLLDACASDKSNVVEKPDIPAEKNICFALYTVNNNIMKMSAQFYPRHEGQSTKVRLDIKKNGKWKKIAASRIDPVAWNAVFKVRSWDSSKDYKYRILYDNDPPYSGIIRHDPVEKDVIVAAAFTGNSPGPGGGKVSKQDVVEYINKIDPDVLLFTGDQVYDHNRHTEHWLEFGETFGEMIKTRPVICLPDDHDVGHGNLWGANGVACKKDWDGGYLKPASYVNMVQRQQTSHMPDPFDATPVERGITVYYTSVNVGGIDFAIIEDRKFKSGCNGVAPKGFGPRPDHIDKPGYDPKTFDLPDKKLLGDRQLEFLDQWGQDWKGTVIKCVVSQTVFSMTSNYHSKNKIFYYADFDSNGWPQTGRNKAIEAMRKCYAFHICGDQHLSTIVHYGVDDWRDSNYSFCVPSIANLYPRWWAPKEKAVKAINDGREHTGDYYDGFGNKITVLAHTNPVKTGRQPAELHDRMPGFGIVSFDKTTRDIKLECWPRKIDPTDPANAKHQYTGWPRTINQIDNYNRKAAGYLPTLSFNKPDPIVQVIDESNNEVVYTLRIKGNIFTPKVFKKGLYTVKAGSNKLNKKIKGLTAMESQNYETINVKL